MLSRKKLKYYQSDISDEVKSANTKFVRMLAAAYEYYYGDGESGLTDHEYDSLTKEVATLENLINHPKKYLVDFDGLHQCSSLFYIKKNEYLAED